MHTHTEHKSIAKHPINTGQSSDPTLTAVFRLFMKCLHSSWRTSPVSALNQSEKNKSEISKCHFEMYQVAQESELCINQKEELWENHLESSWRQLPHEEVNFSVLLCLL